MNDRDASELRESYRAFTEAVGGERATGASMYSGGIVGTLELLTVCRASSPALVTAADDVQALVANRRSDGLDAAMRAVRVAYRECQTNLAVSRAALLGI
jgi:hypothetical protein